MAGNSGEPIDLARLNEASLGDREFEEILLAAYLEDAQTQLASLDGAVRKLSADRMSAAAHSLKGASSNLGITEAQNICAALERMDPMEDPDGAEMLLKLLRTEIEKVEVFVKGYFAA